MSSASLPNVKVARHAVAIDEKRAFYRKNGISRSEIEKGRDWQELWFPGVHADLGGGYEESEGGLWRVAFDWMVQEAVQHGLVVDPSRLERVRNRCTALRPWAEPVNVSLTPAWKIAEYFPKRHWDKDSGYGYRANMSRPRGILKGEIIHESALRRIQECDYRPANFSDNFIEKVKNLHPVPNSFPYEP